MEKRIEYIDSMKGIGIILVMLGHSISRMDQPLNRVILSFHMPLFFFISGLLLYSRNIENEETRIFVTRKIKTLIIPILTVFTLQVCGDLAENIYKGETVNLITLSSVNWFLIVYFFMEVICWCILKITSKNMKTVVLSIICFFISSVFCPDIIYLKQILIASTFCMIGFLFRPLCDYCNTYNKSGGGIILFVICAYLAAYNSPIGMYKNEYGNIFLFYIIAMIGIAAIFCFSIVVYSSSFIKLLGENSIIIYSSHFFVRRVIQIALIILLGIKDCSVYPIFLSVFGCLLLLEYIIIIINKRFTSRHDDLGNAI